MRESRMGCGSQRISFALTAEISNIFNSTLPLCPSCRAEIGTDDRFCQECGFALPRAQVESDSEPVFYGSTRMQRLHPRLTKSKLIVPLLIVGVAVIAFLGFMLFGFEGEYSGFTNRYVMEQAKIAYKGNRFDEAGTILERYALTHKLTDSESNLLSDVYYARANERANRAQYALALADLNKINLQYSNYPLVTGKRNEILECVKVAQAKARLQNSHGRNTRSASAPSAPFAAKQIGLTPDMVSKRFDKTIEKTLVTAHGALDGDMGRHNPRGGTDSVTEIGTTARAATQRTPSDSAEQDTSSVHSKEGPAAVTGSGKLVSPPLAAKTARAPAKITESDQVRYNELLAGYFSEEHKQAAPSPEPPSLKEWIEQGRPKF